MRLWAAGFNIYSLSSFQFPLAGNKPVKTHAAADTDVEVDEHQTETIHFLCSAMSAKLLLFILYLSGGVFTKEPPGEYS